MGVVHDLIVVPPARPLAGSVPAPPDDAVLATDMADVVGVLRRRGAVIEGELSGGRPGRVMPPLRVGPLDPRRGLSGTEEDLTMGASDVKEALLLSGPFADEPTFVR